MLGNPHSFPTKLYASFLSPFKNKAKKPKMRRSLIVLREEPGDTGGEFDGDNLAVLNPQVRI